MHWSITMTTYCLDVKIIVPYSVNIGIMDDNSPNISCTTYKNDSLKLLQSMLGAVVCGAV